MAASGSGSGFKGSEGIQSLFHDSRSMSTNLEDIHEGEGNRSSFFHNIDMEECMNYEDYEEGFYHPEKKRRLTSTQVESLEKSFDTGNKLEPDRKIQLAKDLGLQPRQVAIWFQNRRARWKTKQLERDYETLKQNYDNLKTNHDSLHEEREKLRTEVMVLKEKLGKSENENVNFKTEEHETAVEEEKPKSTVVCKQEEICSTNSVVMDSDVLQNLNMQKIDRKGNSRGFGFLEEDTDLWSWNY